MKKNNAFIRQVTRQSPWNTLPITELQVWQRIGCADCLLFQTVGDATEDIRRTVRSIVRHLNEAKP